LHARAFGAENVVISSGARMSEQTRQQSYLATDSILPACHLPKTQMPAIMEFAALSMMRHEVKRAE
jgi:hypothetical protein